MSQPSAAAPHLLTSRITDGIFGLYELHSCGSSDFTYEAGKEKLVHLDVFPAEEYSTHFLTPNDHLNGISGDDAQASYGLQGKLLRLAGYIDLDSYATVGAVEELDVSS